MRSDLTKLERTLRDAQGALDRADRRLRSAAAARDNAARMYKARLERWGEAVNARDRAKAALRAAQHNAAFVERVRARAAVGAAGQ